VPAAGIERREALPARRAVDDARAHRARDRLRTAARAELDDDVAEHLLDRALAVVQLLADLARRQPVGDEREHLLLALAELRSRGRGRHVAHHRVRREHRRRPRRDRAQAQPEPLGRQVVADERGDGAGVDHRREAVDLIRAGERDDARVGEIEHARDEVARAVERRVDEDDLRLTERWVRPCFGDGGDRFHSADPVESFETGNQPLSKHCVAFDHHHVRDATHLCPWRPYPRPRKRPSET
jgi:hypothetical protein